jgi:hypothetical protein
MMTDRIEHTEHRRPAEGREAERREPVAWTGPSAGERPAPTATVPAPHRATWA